MRVLVACEYSGRVREAFRKRGHDAWSCDLQDADDGSQHHLKGDCLGYLGMGWDLVIAHPPCTYLSVSGLHWNKRRPERAAMTEAGAGFFLEFTKLTCKWAIENPVSCMSSRYRKPDQIVQPYDFGHDASKKTCLWLNGLPRLVGSSRVPGRMVDGKERWSNQDDSGQNVVRDENGKILPWNGPDTWKYRSKTYQGIADAMAEQWGTPANRSNSGT